MDFDFEKDFEKLAEKIETITSNIFPANYGGYDEIVVNQFYFDTVFVAKDNSSKYFIRIINEPIEYSYKVTDEGIYKGWNYYLHKFLFVKEGDSVWKRCDEADSPADAICLKEINRDGRCRILDKYKPSGKWNLKVIRPITSQDEFSELVNKNLINITEIYDVAEHCRFGNELKDLELGKYAFDEFEFEFERA